MLLNSIFTSIHIVLYDVPSVCVLHWVISHSGASLVATGVSRVTDRYYLGRKLLVRQAHSSFRPKYLTYQGLPGLSLPGPRRTIASPTGLTISITNVSALLFLAPTICHSSSISLGWNLGVLYLPGSCVRLWTAFALAAILIVQICFQDACFLPQLPHLVSCFLSQPPLLCWPAQWPHLASAVQTFAMCSYFWHL